MSLVAYDASSDEESDYEDNEGPEGITVANDTEHKSLRLPSSDVLRGNISDEDDDYTAQADNKEKSYTNSLSVLLPKPKNHIFLSDILDNFTKPTFAALPTPKALDKQVNVEEDDDYLHKKPIEEIIEKPIAIKKMPVKISIPCLKNFHDVEKEIAEKARNRKVNDQSKPSGSSGLLSILPKAKSEQNFAKVSYPPSKNNERSPAAIIMNPMIPSFVPDSVKYKRAATSTEDVERIKPIKKNLHNQTKKPLNEENAKECSDESDDGNAGPGDFFSFNTDQSLPEVSAKEINALVAKKAAKIIETSANFLKVNESQKSHDAEKMQIADIELASTRKRYQEQQLDSEALHALVGGGTKRRRQQKSDIQVIDINSSQVMPDRDEWMRTALASSTTFQPTGVLVDEEPASGTRRKHQITYLAHKAKANEAELQAMWSANRQNRRATQSKYGF